MKPPDSLEAAEGAAPRASRRTRLSELTNVDAVDLFALMVGERYFPDGRHVGPLVFDFWEIVEMGRQVLPQQRFGAITGAMLPCFMVVAVVCVFPLLQGLMLVSALLLGRSGAWWAGGAGPSVVESFFYPMGAPFHDMLMTAILFTVDAFRDTWCVFLNISDGLVHNAPGIARRAWTGAYLIATDAHDGKVDGDFLLWVDGFIAVRAASVFLGELLRPRLCAV